MREEIIITEQIVSDWLSKRLHYYKVLYSLSFKINEERERERIVELFLEFGVINFV